ncbi:MAG: Tyrosine-protein kinase EpsD [Candidatus Jettenia ecosi]|uniref:Tyrosine-protein kinase EpsD n=1 Tax=Candidatus Jettenia ecosi TaxID=2494326 RepID=A0A533Q9U4_9BACT|nr:MAG: Tyrosine-protein kinase EpsD [Candidatus Jettenia ecosi]
MLPFKGDESEEIHILDYVKIIRKRMWMVIIFFVVIVAIVTIKTFKTTPVYQATARVVLEQNKLNVGFQQVISESQFTPLDFYTNQCEIIKSRSIAKKVIDTLNLKNDPVFNPPEKDEYPESAGNRTQDPSAETQFINRFLSPLKVSLMRNSGVVSISYDGHNPQLITRIANMIVKTYIEQDWEKRYNVAKDALDWLNKQLKDVKIALEESEAALQRYKRENDLISVEAVGSENLTSEKQNVVLQKLMELNTAVTYARTERIKLEVLYNKLKDFKSIQYKDDIIQSIPAVVQSPLIQNLKADYARVENDFSLYSQRYGMKHPKIAGLKAELDTMRDNIMKEVEQICDSIATEYEVAINRETTLVTILEQQKNEVFALGDKAIQYGVLKREADTNRQMYETLLTRMKETNLTEDLKTSNIKVLDHAEVPIKPIKPKKALNILLGIIAGLGCGVGIAFVMEYMDNTIRTQEDVEKYLKTSLLGIVGHIPLDKKDTDFTELIAHSSPKHSITEALKGIRTSIIFSHPDKPKKVILVTSSAPSEGKSLISANLAIVMAQTGKKVLLIDADLRKPTMHKLFKIDKSLGLSNVLVKSGDLRTVAKETTIPNVRAIACGPIPPNPSELLSSSAMVEMLQLAKEEFEWIIIDSPPILTVTDARILARVADGAVFVIKSNKTTKDAARKAIDHFSDMRDKLLGVVINDVDFSRDKYYYQYYYQYYYHYGEKEAKEA